MSHFNFIGHPKDYAYALRSASTADLKQLWINANQKLTDKRFDTKSCIRNKELVINELQERGYNPHDIICKDSTPSETERRLTDEQLEELQTILDELKNEVAGFTIDSLLETVPPNRCANEDHLPEQILIHKHVRERAKYIVNPRILDIS